MVGREAAEELTQVGAQFSLLVALGPLACVESKLAGKTRIRKKSGKRTLLLAGGDDGELVGGLLALNGRDEALDLEGVRAEATSNDKRKQRRRERKEVSYRSLLLRLSLSGVGS